MRWQPKRWTRPRSRAWREEHSGPREPFNVAKLTSILKHLWCPDARPEMAFPAWAQTSHKFGWMTHRALYATPRVPTGRMLPGITEQLYRRSPLLGMIPKSKDSAP